TTLEAPSSLPGVAPEHGTAEYWIGRATGADDVLMSAVDIRAHNASFRRAAREAGPPVVGHFDLLNPPQPSALRKEVAERLAYMHERIEAGTYLDGQTSPLSERDKSVFAPPEASVADGGGELRVVLAEVPLRCGPRAAGLYKKPDPGGVVDRAFDRNNCSTLRPQELVRVLNGLGTKRKGMRLVKSGYALGWLSSSAALSPPLSAESARAFATQDKLRVRRSIELRSETGATRKVGPRTLLASAPGDSSRALFATADGVFESQVLGAAAVTSTRRPLTRQALLMEAFDYLGTPYGWGGHKAGRDCSRFMMDVFASFGVALPRYSSLQARAGNMVVDLRKAKSAPERMSLIDEAHTRGVVLLHFPGHIMLYLGRNGAGEPMAIHAFAEYLSPCPKAEGETLYRVREIRVSDLRLGAGSSRRSFLERITKLAVFGRTPGHALLGAVKRRPAAPLMPVESGPQADAQPACRAAKDIEWITSPRHVHPGAPLRLIASSERDLGSVEILLRGPSGQRRQLEPRTVGGPPFGYWSQIPGEDLATGRWTARIGEGEREEACLSFTVHPKPPFRQAGSGAVWVPTRTWNRRRENLYSTFVEQLFDFPPNEDHSWKSLQQLLSRADKNLFYDYLGQGEDSQLSLKPDCADLPYFLRAYFSWKMRLPFAFRHCNRGRKGKAPYCDRELHSHLDDREHAGEVRAFSHFARRNIADGVHSGSGRTGPDDSHTDYYPIALDRRALRPGAVFADPYGHILIIADWVPQGVGSYGVLVGADAQPDGTVGRRRFWRGSFLFKPDTTEAGAGFKAFRPIRYRGGRMRALKNEKITEA
ncbi:MAG: NlpC/P60 family protein, partial [Polyangiaceae bacterium]